MLIPSTISTYLFLTHQKIYTFWPSYLQLVFKHTRSQTWSTESLATLLPAYEFLTNKISTGNNTFRIELNKTNHTARATFMRMCMDLTRALFFFFFVEREFESVTFLVCLISAFPVHSSYQVYTSTPWMLDNSSDQILRYLITRSPKNQLMYVITQV